MHVIGPMKVHLPFAAFNGGAIVAPDGTVLAQYPLDPAVATAAIKLLEDGGVDAWVFAGDDWLLKNLGHPNVDRERRTVNFEPTAVLDFTGINAPIGKIVGVSNDYDRLDVCEAAAREALAGKASVTRSQKYYLDISSLTATKGQGVTALCERIGTPLARTAVIGDMYNDLSMFDVAGLAIAMGNAPDPVKARAQRHTRSNAEDGFAAARWTIWWQRLDDPPGLGRHGRFPGPANRRSPSPWRSDSAGRSRRATISTRRRTSPR